jgi:hypothetical protein
LKKVAVKKESFMPVQTSSSVKNLVNAFEKQPEPVKDTKPLPSRLALNVAPSAKVEPQASKFDCPGSKEERARLRAQTMLALEKTFSQGSSMPTGKTAMPKTVSPKKVLVKTVPEVPVSIAVEQPPVVKKPDEKALFDKAFAKMKELIASPLSGRGARQMAENMLKKPEVAAWFAACKDNQEVLKARTLELAKAFKEHGYLGRQHSPVTKALAVVMQMHASGELGGKVDDFAGGVLKEAKVAPEQILSLLNSYSKKAAYRGEQICEGSSHFATILFVGSRQTSQRSYALGAPRGQPLAGFGSLERRR